MAEVGEADPKTGYAEAVDPAPSKEEEVDLSDYVDFADAYHQLGRFLRRCVYAQTHSLISGLLTPVESRASGLLQQAAGTTID